MSKQISRFAFTLWDTAEDPIDLEELKNDLKANTKHWVVQKEKGDKSGKEHYQGRVHLRDGDKKRSEKLVVKVFAGPMKRARFSIEHDADASTFYCLKEDTRIEGPWLDGKTNQEKKLFMPRDLNKIKEWYPWQTDLFASLKLPKEDKDIDDRSINVLYDPKGCQGKSKVFKMAAWKEWAGCIPSIGDSEKTVQAVCSMGERPAYILDLPRSGEGDKHMFSMMKTIEMVKNGFVYDMRHQWKQSIFTSPVIWIFTNNKINSKFLSEDRWKFWVIDDLKLVRREDGLIHSGRWRAD